MYPRLTHFCLPVERLEDCTRFYQRYCQLEIIQQCIENGQDSIYLSESGHSIGLVLRLKSGGQCVFPSGDNERHLGFSVEAKEIVDVLANMAKAEGALFREPHTYLSGAYCCGITDPNGNIVEVRFEHHVAPVSHDYNSYFNQENP